MRIRQFLTTAGVLVFTATAFAGNTIHVPADFATIQAAIDAASSEDGDEIIVAPGTYHEAINFLGKAITVRSSGGAQVTTIDAQPLAPPTVSVVTFASGEGRDSIIDGFTIRGGTGTAEASPLGTHAGGGILIRESSPTIRNCIITQNMANYGAGISVTFNADPLIDSCQITQNQGFWGGGVAIGMSSAGHIVNSSFEFNTATVGGGMMMGSNKSVGGTLIEHSTFLSNSAPDNGAAANINNNAFATFKSCTFTNHASRTVLIHSSPSTPTAGADFEDCHFTATGSNTTAIWTGGPTSIVGSTFVNMGRAIHGSSLGGSEPYSVTIEDSHFEKMVGGTIGATHWGGSLTITNCSFVDNSAGSSSFSAGAVNATGLTTITGCTFIGNKTSASTGGGAIHQAAAGGSNLIVTDSLFVNNISSAAGGAIRTNVHATIENSGFENNAAPSGGAVFIGGGSSVVSSISGCTFEGNVATNAASGGGALLKGGSSALTVADSTFAMNESAGTGGAVRHDAGTLTVINSTITGNSAATGGGASRSGPTGELLFQSTLFCENSPDNIAGDWTDLGGNSFHDECPECAPADLNCDGVVGVADLLLLLAAWGACPDCAECAADLTGDCAVGIADLLLLLASWG